MTLVERPFAERSASVTERGRRPVNQDAALAVPLSDGAELVAVADGMGGHAAGEVASGRALEALRAAVEAGAGLLEAVERANDAVLAEATKRPECTGMGTTLVALLRRGSEYYIANVGDSRAYRVDGDGIRQLTRDHSFVEDAVRSGQLTAEEAGASPWRNALTRAVGLGPELEVDCYGPFSAAETHAVVLCTDGLYRVLADETIRRAVSDADDPAAVAQTLAAAAHDGGSEDNISLAVVRFGPAFAQERVGQRPRGPDGLEGLDMARPDGEWQNGHGHGEESWQPPAGDDAPQPRERRSRRRPGRAVRRWAALEMAAILLGLLAVILYVLFLTRML